MKVRELFTDESKWTQGAMARDFFGTARMPSDPAATCFCFLGAVRHCYGDSEKARGIIHQAHCLVHGPVQFWNDAPERRFEHVKMLVERLDI